jgi:zinc protease
MLMRGTQNRSRQEIQDELDRLRAQGGVGGGVSSSSCGFTTVRENLPAVLRLAGEILKEPAFDEAQFELLKEERIAGLEAQLAEPQPQAIITFQRHLSPYPEDHPRYVAPLDEQIARLQAATLADARAFWERFYGAGGGTLSIVGDFDPAEIRPVIEEVFGDWTSGAAYARIDQPYRSVEQAELDIETPDKANAMMVAGMNIQMTDEDPDYPALVLGNYMLGGGFLNSRLAVRIRQEEGLSYGVGSQFSAHPIDDNATFLTFAIFAPENGDRVVEAFRAVMNEVLADGFTAEEVEAAKRGYLDAAQNGRTSDNAIANAIEGNLFFDRTMAFTAEQEAAIRTLTPEQILAAMRRHIDVDRISIVRAGDFAGKLVP